MKSPIVDRRGKAAALFIDLQEEHRQDSRYLVEGFDDDPRQCPAPAGSGAPTRRAALSLGLYRRSRTRQARPFHPVDGRRQVGLQRQGRSADGDLPGDRARPMARRMLVKTDASAFATGRLRPCELKARGIEWLVVAGVWTEACVARHGARTRSRWAFVSCWSRMPAAAAARRCTRRRSSTWPTGSMAAR